MRRVQHIALLGSLVLLGNSLWGQVTTATILGTVKDETGAVLPGASVTIQNLDTGTLRTLISDDEGRYRASNLALGNYEVQVELPGFQRSARRGIALTVGREAVVDVTLKVGEITEVVEVIGEAPLVETTRSSIGALVDEKTMRDLPLNRRSFEQLAFLQPGVVWVRTGVKDFRSGSTEKFTIAGARPYQNLFLLDGTNINARTNYTPGSTGGYLLGVETVREFRIETSNYSAEFGGAAGGVVNIASKAGTNAFHGSVFEFLRNDNLDARNFFDVGPPPEFKRNQFGFTVGGPIVRNKAFFFGGYEGIRERLGLTTIATVPNADARLGLIPDRGRVVQVAVNPLIRPLLDLYPLPNGRDFGDGTGEFLGTYSQPADQDNVTVRVDHHFSERNLFFVRYTLDEGRFSPLTDPLPLMFEDMESRNQYVTIEQTSILSPTWLNRSRFGFNRSFRKTGRGQNGISRDIQFAPGVPLIESGDLRPGGGITELTSRRLPREEAYNVFQWADDLQHNRGRHSLKAGVLVQRIQFNERKRADSGGRLEFRGLRLFLEGRLNVFQVLLPDSQTDLGYFTTLFGWYVQDDIRLAPTVTLNVGLRHEFITNPTEAHGRIDLMTSPFDITLRFPDSLFETDKNTVAPRIGFAWNPGGHGRTAVRSGFGIFYEHVLPTFGYGSNGGTFNKIVALRNPPFPPYEATVASPAIPQGDTAYMVTHTPYRMQWNLSLQRQLGTNNVFEVGYLGARGVHLIMRRDFRVRERTILPDGRAFFPPGAPFLGQTGRLEDFTVRTTDGSQTYHGLIVGLNRRFSGGVQFQGSYTLSKSIDEGGQAGGNDFGTSSQGLMDPLNPRLDRSLSDWDIRHNFVFNATYDLPLGPGKHFGADATGFGGKLLEGWQVNGIVMLATGFPFTGAMEVNQANTGPSGRRAQSHRPNLVAGRSSSPVLGGPDRYFDPLAFELQEFGTFGNLGRNTILGSGLATVDFSVVKKIPVSETNGLQFRVEFFNLFNRANFGVPQRFLFDRSGRIGSAGRITTTTTTARQIQLGLKYIF